MIYINNIPSLRDPEKSEIILDHRIEKTKVIGGVVVQDFGHIKQGIEISLECIFEKKQYTALIKLWASKARVSYIDEAGNTWEDMKLVLRRLKFDRCFKDYVWVTFELWKAKDLDSSAESPEIENEG